MSYTKETINGKTTLKIEASLTIYDAPVLREEILDCYANSREVTVDVEEVTECDTAGIQLLFAAGKNARKDSQSFRVIGESIAITDALKCLGLNAEEVKNG